VSGGTLTVIYRETDSARGKIRVWVDERNKTVTIENLLDQPILVNSFAKLTYADGRVESGWHGWAEWEARKKTTGLVDFLPVGTTWETWAEVKVK
jgi:hypothetical protein